jgi:hypothetical protein
LALMRQSVLLILCVVAFALCPATADSVIDGDTLYVGRLKYLLCGINAPERSQPGACAATDYLRQLIGGKTMACTPVGEGTPSRRCRFRSLHCDRRIGFGILCGVAWKPNPTQLCRFDRPGSYSGSTITFGLPPSIANVKSVFPKICQPFTLRHEGPGVVRVSANTLFKPWGGPLASRALCAVSERKRCFPVLRCEP